MKSNSRWYSILLIGLILLVASSVVGCAPSYTKEDVDAAFQEGYKTGYKDGSGHAIEQDYQQHFIQGNAYLDQEQWDEAIAEYTKAIELNPEFADAYANRAVAYNEKGDYYELAILDCEKAVELEPLVKLDSSLAQAYVQRGNFNAQFIDGGCNYDESYEDDKKDLDKAVSDFTRAIELAPRLAEAYKGRADCYIDFYECKEDLDFYATDYYKTAIEDYSMAIVLDPMNAAYYKSRAWAYDRGGDYDREMVDITKAIELDPTNAAYYRSRGLTYMDASNYTKAIADFTKAIELEPEDNHVYSYRGEAYMEIGSYDLAVIDYTEAIELTPKSWWLSHLYNERGGVYLKQGDYDKAIADYTKAIELDDFSSPVYYNDRALAYLEQQNYDLAIADSSKAIELYSKSEDAYWTRGQAYAALNQNNKAIADFEECLALSEWREPYWREIKERNQLIREWIDKLQSD